MNSVHPESMKMSPASWEGQHAAPLRHRERNGGTAGRTNLGPLVPFGSPAEGGLSCVAPIFRPENSSRTTDALSRT
jgi:hypothetical protein